MDVFLQERKSIGVGSGVRMWCRYGMCMECSVTMGLVWCRSKVGEIPERRTNKVQEIPRLREKERRLVEGRET
jgi:hypothetical protein